MKIQDFIFMGDYMYTIVDVCPDCGSDDIVVIDRVWDYDEQVYLARHICNKCGNDWDEIED